VARKKEIAKDCVAKRDGPRRKKRSLKFIKVSFCSTIAKEKKRFATLFSSPRGNNNEK
jgi:hypothetical protein